MRKYVFRDLVRNPRRTLAAMIGLALGVGLFAGVLFFIDASSATMTRRSIAPLAVDMQRVLTSPLGRSLRLEEAASVEGRNVQFTLTVHNNGADPANEVVVKDEPPPPLSYLHGTTRLDGKVLEDVAGQSPLSQGLAGVGFNLGTVEPGRTITLSYLAQSQGSGVDLSSLRLRGTISSRENSIPASANAPDPLPAKELRRRIAAVPGVASADELAFLDLDAGRLHAGKKIVESPVRVFAFDRTYQRHYPSIRMVSGSLGDGATLSVEAARALDIEAGSNITLDVPGRDEPLVLPVSGTVDLARATPLFSSRKSKKFEDFLYVPHAVIVPPATFERVFLSAIGTAGAKRGNLLGSPLLVEIDVLIDRTLLDTDPKRASAQTRKVARFLERIAPEQDYLIDNISNNLEVARDDAAVGKRMFFFLGLPAVLLAVFFASYFGSILAATSRREYANLRVRGADRRVLVRLLVKKSTAIAALGSVAGVAGGLASVGVILGSDALRATRPASLATSATTSLLVGFITTALALTISGVRSLRRQVAQERFELPDAFVPLWRRLNLDLAFLGLAAIGGGIAFAAGAFNAPAGSVSAGDAVSLPSHLLLVALVAAVGGVMFFVRLATALTARVPLPAPPYFGRVVPGTLGRSLRRRPSDLAAGMTGVGLVVAFAAGLSTFSASYISAKQADSRFTVGSDIRVTPSVVGTEPASASLAPELKVPGVEGVAPVVFKLENSVLVGPYDQNRMDLAAIDPDSFRKVAALSDSFFRGASASNVISRLNGPNSILLDATVAEDFSVRRGQQVKVLLARGTKNQTVRTFQVAGLFDRFPGFPQHVHIVANLADYQAATGGNQVDFFLLKTSHNDRAATARIVNGLRDGPGARHPIHIDTTRTALNKDQSSLTALNVLGLLRLGSFYALLMSSSTVGLFVSGLLLHRRREYVTLRALGIRVRQLYALVLTEATVVASAGALAGVIVGAGTGYMLVAVLHPMFILPPIVNLPPSDLTAVAGLTLAAAFAAGMIGAAMIRGLKPTEILRESAA